MNILTTITLAAAISVGYLVVSDNEKLPENDKFKVTYERGVPSIYLSSDISSADNYRDLIIYISME